MLVVCPGCNTNYSIDERTISGSTTRLICRECGTETIVAMQGAPESSTSSQTRGATQTPPSQADSAATTASTAVTSAGARAPEPSAAEHAVSCPSCGHRFVPSAEPASAAKKSQPDRPHSKLLLVEDQGYFIQLTKDALGPDFEVTAVNDVPGAEKALTQDRYDLVILDLSLQGNQDGRGLLRSIHKRSIPVLIFTARDESDFYGSVWEDLKAAGATDILLKGVNVGEELKRKVVGIVGMKPAK